MRLAGLLLAQLVWPEGQVTTQLGARLSPALDHLSTSAHVRFTPARPLDRLEVLLPAGRYTRLPAPMRPIYERELFVGGHDLAEVSGFSARLDGVPCDPAPPRPDGALVLVCTASLTPGRTVVVDASAELVVPEMYGPFGRAGSALTLAAGWYPFVTAPGGGPIPGPVEVSVDAPATRPVVIRDEYFPPDPDAREATRRLRYRTDHARQIPLLVLTPGAGVLRVERLGLALSEARAARDPAGRPTHLAALIHALLDAQRFWDEQGAPWPGRTPLVVVAPLRHELAQAADGVVLVSDRAFRLLPAERFLRFHQIHVARELFCALAHASLISGTGGGEAGVAAELIAAALRDAFAKSAETAFDVLGFWSFIPSVDALLYAPDLPFLTTYFPRVDESDPARPDLLDPGLSRRPGKLLWEKLVDRVGPVEGQRVARRLLSGEALWAAVPERTALEPWLGPRPALSYRLLDARSTPQAGHHRAEVRFERRGEGPAEPIRVRLEDEDGGRVDRVAPPSAEPVQVLTATLAAPLAVAELDPLGRLLESPSEDAPSPRFDNRSRPAWKWLLNSWNLALSATAGTLDTALDVGLRRVWDVRWSYALRADYAPSAVALSGRASYGFGALTNAATLSHRLGLIVAGEYLRPSFGGAAEGAFALSSALFYSYDTRETVWVPEGGRGVRASLEHNHLFGAVEELGEDGVRTALSEDALRLSLRAFQSWRIDGRHLLSVRGNAGSYLVGRPRRQLLYDLGGRFGVRGYAAGARLGRARGQLAVEWLASLFPRLDENAGHLATVTGMDGTLFFDVAWIGDDPQSAFTATPVADVGYGLRLYLDYFGVRPGIMALDVAVPLLDEAGRLRPGPPEVYLDFSHSF